MTTVTKSVTQLDRVVIRFAGDSGDGVQTIGDQFGLASAVAGNDIATLPDFPAEIRAPAGTLNGVSGFQLQFGSQETLTAGDHPDVLVVFNPAALMKNLADLRKGGTVIADPDNFGKRDLKLIGRETNPLEDGTLEDYQVHTVQMTKMTVEALSALGLKPKAARRCTNFFALGLAYWLYDRSPDATLQFLQNKFKNKPEIIEANTKALKTGFHYGETAESFSVRYEIAPRTGVDQGTYRSITGNQAVAMGLVTAARKSNLELVFAGYPITPASDILHALSGMRGMGLTTLQAEDEIAAIGMALGASYGGALGVTATSGPGIALKAEFIGLALSAELPLVIINVQRGGPSTGLPTKMEQADLNQAIFGRHGESPLPVVAASSPSDAFDAVIEASRIALRHMTPVMLLTDGNIANGSEPWLIPDADDIAEIAVKQATDPENFLPYSRELDTLARPWAVPGTPGLEHRIGGLEKQHETGNISYDPDNHALMTELRQKKVDAVADFIPDTEVMGDADAKVCVLGWGSPYGPIASGLKRLRDDGLQVAHIHLRHLAPLPKDLHDLLVGFDRIVIPENNSGQLLQLIRGTYAIDAHGVNMVRGLPFKAGDIETAVREHIVAAAGGKS
jgi:2-oxoglutarate ferredoxin oxidoreductase subunit alpha